MANVGSAEILINPELNDRLLAQFFASTQAKLRGKKLRQPVIANLDILNYRAKLQAATSRAAEQQVQLKINAERFGAELKMLRRRFMQRDAEQQLQVNIDTMNAHRQMAAFAQRWSRLEINAQLEAASARAQLRLLTMPRTQTIELDHDLAAYAIRLRAATMPRVQRIELSHGLRLYHMQLRNATRPVEQEIRINVTGQLRAFFQRQARQITEGAHQLRRGFQAFHPVVLSLTAALAFLLPQLVLLAGSLSHAATSAVALVPVLGAVAQGGLAIVGAFAGIPDAMSELQRLEELKRSGLATDAMIETAQRNVAIARENAGEAAFRLAEVLHGEALPAVRDMQRELANAAAPQFTEAIRNLMGVLDVLKPSLRESAVIMSNLALEFSEMATSPEWQEDFGTIGESHNRILQDLGDAGLSATEILKDLYVAVLPQAERFAEWLKDSLESLEDIVNEARESGDLQEFFKEAGDEAAQWGRVLRNLSGTIVNIFSALDDQSGDALDSLEKVTAQWKEWTESEEGQETLNNIFQTIRDIDWAGVAKALGVLAGISTAVAGVSGIASILGFFATPVIAGIVTLIGGFAAGLALLFANSEKIREKFVEVWDVLKNRFGPILEEIFEFWKENILPIIEEAAEDVFQTLIDVINEIADTFERNKDDILDFWKNMVEVVVPVVVTIVKALIEGIGFAIKVVINTMGFLNRATETVGSWFTWLNQNIIQPVWSAIQTAISFAWNSIIKPVFNFISSAVETVGNVFNWLWKNIIQPVWNGITIAVEIAWILLQGIFLAIGFIIENVVVPTFRMFGRIAQIVWNGIVRATEFAWVILRTIFNVIWDAISNVLGPIFMWLWQNVIEPVWEGAKRATETAWIFIRAIFSAIMDWLSVHLGPAFEIAGDIIAGVWDYIETIINNAWEFIRDDVFDPMRRFVMETIPDAFRTAVTAIGDAWSAIQRAVATPVNAVIRFINDPLIAGFNSLAEAVGSDIRINTISEVTWGSSSTPSGGGGGTAMAFDKGGIVPGYAPGRDSMLSFLSPGEGVLRPEAVRALGETSIDNLNLAARTGTLGNAMGQGPIDDVADFLGGAVSNIGDSVMDFLSSPVDSFKDAIGNFTGGGDSAIGGIINSFAGTAIDAVADKLSDIISTGFGAIGDVASGLLPGGGSGSVGGWQAQLSWIQSQIPGTIMSSGYRPGDWGYHGVGRAVDLVFADGSERTGGGLARAAFNAIKGQFFSNIRELIWDFAGSAAVYNGQNHFFTGPTAGPGTHADHIHWAMDGGGMLPPGRSTIDNNTGGPEAVLTRPQWAAMSALAGNGAAAQDRHCEHHLYVEGEPIEVIADRRIDKYDEDFSKALESGSNR